MESDMVVIRREEYKCLVVTSGRHKERDTQRPSLPKMEIANCLASWIRRHCKSQTQYAVCIARYIASLYEVMAGMVQNTERRA